MYSSINDLLNEFRPEELAILTGDPSGTSIDQARITYAIKNATEVIDSYLRERFPVPFASTPPLINLIARELSIANLFEYSNHSGSLPPTIARRRYYALYLLRQVQSGELHIELPSGSERRKSLHTNKDPDNRLFDQNLLDTFVEL
ncbi:MAG: DUF1320 domain-containing protein [Ignavibacteria bacterium]|nr:DUF1320 domain-containing protein [Ignavibacteria bacterium]